MTKSASLLVVLAVLAVATALNVHDRVQMEQDVSVFKAHSWILGDHASDELLTLRFILKRDDQAVANFEKIFLDLSNPKSKNYGHWLNVDEVTELLAPPQSALDTVIEFLAHYGVNDYYVNRNRDIVRIEVQASLAERMFNTTLYKFHNVHQESRVVVRVVEPYSLPEEVANVVSFVADLIRLPRVNMKHFLHHEVPVTATSDSWSSCGTKYSSYVNPAVLQERYGSPADSTAQSGNSMAVAEFQLEYYDDTDLEDFSSQCGIDTVTVTTVYGGNEESYCEGGLERCVESLLDIEYIGALGQPIPLSVYYFSSYSLYDWIEEVNDNDDAELVHSVSYGNDEAQQTSTAYMDECNTDFMKAGARGLSIFFAAGDQGVWGREGTEGTTFHPDFPAGSPYVTAVGGTNFVTKSTIGDESAWEDGGGGFSDTFSAADWQTDAISTYFSTAADSLPPSRYYNAEGRGYPDVSALGGETNPYLVSFKAGSFGGVYGTSAASPVVAGIFAQLNNVRLKYGSTSLGFLNQLIYENSDAFNDVTSGTNDGGNTYGFTAVAGWDPATGMGTPNYEKLAVVIANL